jgi:hypothetical protein
VASLLLKIPACAYLQNVSGHCKTKQEMKRILTILAIIIFTTISCSDNKSETTPADIIELKNENNTDTQNLNNETSDTFITNNYSDTENQTTYIKDLDLFWIRDLEEIANKKVGFISLSDIYPLSEHSDSIAIPNLENVEKENQLYFKLNSTFRKSFLSKTNISETDSVYIYDYSTDVLLSFSVNKLNVVAYLNSYMDIKDCPCNQYDYMIGFEVSKKLLNGLGKYYSDALVFIGKENPFTKGRMKPIVWEKIEAEVFPSTKSNLTEKEKKYIDKNAIKGQTYLYETDLYQIFIQDYKDSKREGFYATVNRHLIVINKQNNKVENETLFSSSEGSKLAPLNFGIDGNNYETIQWIGSLFKNKPDVIFGFEWVSFGCPSIDYINSNDNKYIEINCDNRH